MRIEQLNPGDKVHVQRLNRCSQYYKNRFNDTKGSVIRALTTSEVSQLTQGTVNEPGLLVNLTPNPTMVRHAVFGNASMFGENEFIITNLDIFEKI